MFKIGDKVRQVKPYAYPNEIADNILVITDVYYDAYSLAKAYEAKIVDGDGLSWFLYTREIEKV